MHDLKIELRLADQKWQSGLLADASERYERMREQSWHAAFQAAWIDSAFGPIDLKQVKASAPLELPHRAEKLLETLENRAAIDSQHPRLPGNPAEWDIRRLRQQPNANDFEWWIDMAKLSEDSGLWGLAMSCWRKAEVLEPIYFYDPPSRMQRLPLKNENHLQTLRQVDLMMMKHLDTGPRKLGPK